MRKPISRMQRAADAVAIGYCTVSEVAEFLELSRYKATRALNQLADDGRIFIDRSDKRRDRVYRLVRDMSHANPFNLAPRGCGLKNVTLPPRRAHSIDDGPPSLRR